MHFMSEIIQSFSSAQPCRWHSYGVMQGLFLRISLSKRCNITQQRYAQLFTKPRLVHLPVPWCPPFISQDGSVKLPVITLGSDRVAGASATTHHPIPLLATSVSCGPPCACWKIKTLKCRCYACDRIPSFHISTLTTCQFWNEYK